MMTWENSLQGEKCPSENDRISVKRMFSFIFILTTSKVLAFETRLKKERKFDKGRNLTIQV